jgi:hypothetical protein
VGSGQSWYVCARARYVRRPQLRAPSPLCARRDRDDGPPDGDGARQRGGERPDAHSMDVSVPFYLNSSLRVNNRLFPPNDGRITVQ